MLLDNERIRDLIEAQYHYFQGKEPERAAEVVDQLMEPLYDIGRYPELLEMLERSIDLLEQIDPRFLLFHARTLTQLGRQEEALDELEKLESYMGEDPEFRAAILIDRGNALRRYGDRLRANEMVEAYHGAFALYETELLRDISGDERRRLMGNQATCLFNEGTIYFYFLDDPGKAKEKFEEARTLWKGLGDEEGSALCTKQVAEIHARREFAEFYDLERAVAELEEARAVFERLGLKRRVLEALYQLGRIERRNPERALEIFTQYVSISEELGLRRERAVANRHIAELEWRLLLRRGPGRGELEEAARPIIERLKASLHALGALTIDIWSRRTTVNCHYLLGSIQSALGDLDRAADHYRESLKASEGEAFRRPVYGDARRRLRALLRLYLLEIERGEAAAAEVLLKSAEEDLKLMGFAGPPSVGRVDEWLRDLDRED